MFPGNGLQRCATGFKIYFLLFGGCVKNVSPISSNVYINHAVLKRPLAQWTSEVISYVSAAARYTQQLKWSHFICVRCSSQYATIEVKSFHMCLLQLSIRNNWSEVISYVSTAALYTQQLKWSHFICVHPSSLYATIEVKSFHMCPLQLAIHNNWRNLKTCLS